MLTVDFKAEDKKPETAYEFHRDTADLVSNDEIPIVEPYNEAEECNKPDFFKKKYE